MVTRTRHNVNVIRTLPVVFFFFLFSLWTRPALKNFSLFTKFLAAGYSKPSVTEVKLERECGVRARCSRSSTLHVVQEHPYCNVCQHTEFQDCDLMCIVIPTWLSCSYFFITVSEKAGQLGFAGVTRKSVDWYTCNIDVLKRTDGRTEWQTCRSMLGLRRRNVKFKQISRSHGSSDGTSISKYPIDCVNWNISWTNEISSNNSMNWLTSSSIHYWAGERMRGDGMLSHSRKEKWHGSGSQEDGVYAARGHETFNKGSSASSLSHECGLNVWSGVSICRYMETNKSMIVVLMYRRT
jgi:hypothetical protein